MIRFQGQPLRKKLMALMLMTSISVLLLMTLGFAVSDWHSSRAEVFDRLGAQAAIIGSNTVGALTFRDVNSANQTLASLERELSVVGAVLFDAGAGVFARFGRGAVALPTAPPEGAQGTLDGLFYVYLPVQLDGEVIGHILILSELGNWYAHQLQRLGILLGLFVIALLVAVILSRKAELMVTTPILKLADTVRKITDTRNYNLRASTFSTDEIGMLAEDFNVMLEQIQLRDNELQQIRAGLEDKVVERTAELFELNERLRHQAYHDPLTGLANRITFDNSLKSGINFAQRHGTSLAVCFLDLDRFKSINDTLGHTVGDKLLIEMAQRLQHSLRDSDTLARLGGDEFAVLLLDTEPGIAADIAAKLIDTISQPVHIDGYNLQVTTSIGISMYPSDGSDVTTILRNADTAMYCSKEAGRNQLSFYAAEMNARAERRLIIENKLRVAVAENRFQVYYQPKFDVKTLQLVGLEALVRWFDRDEGCIHPDEFIPLAEDCGLIGEIDLWVMRTACREMGAIYGGAAPEILLSVNFSPAHFIRQDVYQRIARVLADTGFPGTRLELEVTETLVVSEVVGAYEQMKKIRAMGVEISIDDFGVGYSSLSRLKQLPINTLKIDRSFIKDIGTDQDDEVLVRTIIDMAHNLNLKVVAEGVETEAQYQFILRHHCDSVQGFLFGRPVPAADIARLIAGTSLLPV